ncbi:MAG: diguanylate cyclase [Clostridia bacterium]|nr:diguanylate cyclase [Clostridia bacterium]
MIVMKQYSIGEFSDKTGVSKRMLRHYDKLNLLCPIHINEMNGYRYYSEDQEEDLIRIQMLQQMGFSLSEVKSLLHQTVNFSEFIELLKDKEVEVTQKSDELKTSVMMLRRFILKLQSNQLESFPTVSKLLDLERSKAMTVGQNRVKVEFKNLLSREVFLERLEELMLLDQKDHYHFITFDIDSFMSINDEYGYDVGDRVIINVVNMIYDNMKAVLEMNSDTNLIARLGGDECSIFLKNAEENEVKNCIEATFQAIRSFDFTKIGCKKDVSVSCGAVRMLKPAHHKMIHDLSGRALVDAKRNGRNQYIYMNINQ